jgi:hypothetical protein
VCAGPECATGDFRGVGVASCNVNADDDQRADDLERVLDEGDLERAAKMVGRWSKPHAQIAVTEVQSRNAAHRADAVGSAQGDTSLDLSSFARRDDELSSLRRTLEA